MQTEAKILRPKQPALSFYEKLRNIILVERLQHPVGYLILAVAAFLISLLIVFFGYVSSVILIVLITGIPLVFGVLAYPKFGIITLLVGSYFIMWFDRMGGNLPLGTLMDGIQILLIIGFFFKHKYDKTWDFIKSPISVIIILWIIYNFLEILNPVAESRLAWVFTVRTVAIVMFTYFIFMYYIRDINFIRLIFKIWIGLSFFAALYAFKQEYFDFFGFEKKWLANDPVASSLYFIDGHWRKFSIFSDPVSSAYNMVISTLLCISLMFGPISKIKKIVLGILSCFFMMAMLYSGTRGAFVLIPAGIVMLLILKLNAKTIVLGAILGVVFIFLLKVPTSNGNLQRFQTAFSPSNDPSFLVRRDNQKRIQPYIQSHPMGGGLGSTGTWGQRFSPHSYLASFPPDSGYVRVAVEMGWIGLFLLCTLMFIVLKTGIENYFKIHDPELKSYCLAMILIVFVLTIGNYPQEALVQFPVNIYFYLVIALINITYRLDLKLQEDKKMLELKTVAI